MIAIVMKVNYRLVIFKYMVNRVEIEMSLRLYSIAWGI